MGSRKYLLVFHAVSSGQNGDHLGSDEQDIVLLVYLILDVANNKVVSVHQFPVKPTSEDVNQNVLSEEVQLQYGISESDIKMAGSLSFVIAQFDSVLREQIPQGAANYTLVTDGPLHIRQALFPEAFRKNMTLPAYYQRYHDLRKEFQSAFPSTTVRDSVNVDDMLSSLGIPNNTAPDLAIRTVNNMAKIIQKFLSEGRQLHEPDTVQLNLQQGIRSKNEQVDTNCVVRARGLPWQASDTDIARFFIGLNVAPGGVALCLSAQGRRNGEALVLFESQAHRDMALRRHKHHIGNRYIEVYKATGEDFIDVAGGNNSEAQEFLARGGQVIIRMRGLPYDCSSKQVIEFFNNGEEPCHVLDGDQGVLFVKKPDGRSTGDAFVLFKEETDAEKALQKHKEIIGSRYIELFRSTTAEVQQVLNRSCDPSSGKSHGGGVNGAGSTPLLPAGAGSLLPALPALPSLPPMAVIPQQLITAGTKKDCIRLRGLPYEAQVEHILEFLGDHAKNIVYQGVHMVFNAQGQPSGEAFIQMDNENSAHQAASNKHHRYMVFGKKQRYIEVFQCSGEDMSLVLTGGLLQPTSTSAAVTSANNLTVAAAAAAAAAGKSSSLMSPPPGMLPTATFTPQALAAGGGYAVGGGGAATNAFFLNQPPPPQPHLLPALSAGGVVSHAVAPAAHTAALMPDPSSAAANSALALQLAAIYGNNPNVSAALLQQLGGSGGSLLSTPPPSAAIPPPAGFLAGSSPHLLGTATATPGLLSGAAPPGWNELLIANAAACHTPVVSNASSGALGQLGLQQQQSVFLYPPVAGAVPPSSCAGGVRALTPGPQIANPYALTALQQQQQQLLLGAATPSWAGSRSLLPTPPMFPPPSAVVSQAAVSTPPAQLGHKRSHDEAFQGANNNGVATAQLPPPPKRPSIMFGGQSAAAGDHNGGGGLLPNPPPPST